MPIKESELIINPDGSIYHLKLRPDEIAKNIITVGDPERVNQVAKHLDKIQLKRKSREFYTITGLLGKKRITIISTGIGTDNIDIVFNELDALVNINFKTQTVKKKLTALKFYRIGTSGSVHKDIPVDHFVASRAAIGFDGLLHYYNYKNDAYERKLSKALIKEHNWITDYPTYLIGASSELMKKFPSMTQGLTLTANGFYGPQGRILRLKTKFAGRLKKMHNQEIQGMKISNLEMETAGIYGLARMLGHQAISLNAILANRASGHFSKNAKQTVSVLIKTCLEKI